MLHGPLGPTNSSGNDAPAKASNAKLGLLLLPVSILVILIGLVTGQVAVWIIGIAFAAGDVALYAGAVLQARRRRQKS